MNIYYSRSNDVKDELIDPHIQNFINRLPPYFKEKVNLTRHEKNTNSYNPELLKEADLIIVGVTNRYHYIGKGCYEEIFRATELNIPVLFIVPDHSDYNGFYFATLGEINTETIGIKDPTSWKDYAQLDGLFNAFYKDETPSYHINDNDDDSDLEYLNLTFYSNDNEDVALYFDLVVLPNINSDKYQGQTNNKVLESNSYEELLLLG